MSLTKEVSVRKGCLTAKDVAVKVGLSRATVSRILSGDEKPFSPKTVKQVKDIVKELGYRPNSIARNLRMNRTNTIAVIVPKIEGSFYQKIVSSVEKRIKPKYALLMGVSGYDPTEEGKLLNKFAENRVDGIILVSTGKASQINAETIQKIREEGIALVMLDRLTPGTKACLVSSDHFNMSALATKHLIDLGHRDIIYISNALVMSPTEERKKGYCQTMTDAGLGSCIRTFSKTNDSRTADFGKEVATEIFERKLPISAVVLNNDTLAPCFMTELRRRGISIPGQVSVFGMDDIPISEYQTPPLSTVRQNTKALGFEAATLLMGEMGKPLVLPKKIMLPVELVLRESVAKHVGPIGHKWN